LCLEYLTSAEVYKKEEEVEEEGFLKVSEQ